MSNYIVTIDLIVSKGPCYHPSKHLPDGYTATLAQFMRTQKQVPPQDRVWVASQLMNDRDCRLFAVACARMSLINITNADIREVCESTCIVAERFANGAATEAELSAAWSAAVAVTWSAAASASAAAWSAAWSAASAADSAARSARSAAGSAADSAAWAASAAYSAESAASAADSAAVAEAWSAESAWAASAAYSAASAWAAVAKAEAYEKCCEILVKYLTDIYGE